MVLDDVSCKIGQGIYGLLGPNGAGKTTLMRCLTNLYPLTKGTIRIGERDIKKTKKMNIGYLPQQFGLFKELKVEDSMKYFCNIKGIPRKEREAEIQRCLRIVNMEGEKNKISGNLSGGMMRRIGVAQSLLGKPPLILFDEPTAGLDPEERMRFKNTISNLGKEETVIISTHIVEDVEACCDKVIVMNGGKILCIKTCEELKELAMGKVIACKKGREAEIPGQFLIEKQYEKNNEIYYRILLHDAEQINGQEVLESTIEDGYMTVIKENCIEGQIV